MKYEGGKKMITLQRTDSTNRDFIEFVRALDAELAFRDGGEHSFYAQFNTIDMIRFVVVAYEDMRAVGCGAIKEFAPGVMEVKRMYTLPAYRGKGIAAKVLGALESWAAELGCEKCVLETGKRQPEAIALYEKSGYQIIQNYGQYIGVENSVCFEKEVRR
jgi:putative acetyltransferase